MDTNDITDEMREAVAQEMAHWAKFNLPTREAIQFVGALAWVMSELGGKETTGGNNQPGAE